MAEPGTVRFGLSIKVDMEEVGQLEPNQIAAFFGGIAEVLAAKADVEEEADRG